MAGSSQPVSLDESPNAKMFESQNVQALHGVTPALALELSLTPDPQKGAGSMARQADAAAKRAMDIGLASALLLFFAPLFVVLVVLIKRDGGPAFFHHQRIGRNGAAFSCIKFRSMCVGAEGLLIQLLTEDPSLAREWSLDFKLRNDPRVTPIGRFLRKSSLDELPQLINVVKGEMSLVGPRPIVASEIPRYGEDIQHYLSCRPGLTGLWQVSGRNNTSYAERVSLDVEYGRRVSVATDCIILAKTFLAVLTRRGAF